VTATLSNLNPSELVNSLDAEAIAARLDELEREAQALRVLLRSARARQGAQRRRDNVCDKASSARRGAT
jgi:hypothetical protein